MILHDVRVKNISNELKHSKHEMENEFGKWQTKWEILAQWKKRINCIEIISNKAVSPCQINGIKSFISVKYIHTNLLWFSISFHSSHSFMKAKEKMTFN